MTKPKKVRIFIMDKAYEVPAALTIQKALEYAGYQLVRGCGCRGGFCGACATVFRSDGDYRLKVGLACATMVENNMHLTQIPFYPAQKASYDVNYLKPTLETLLQTYPEILKCLGCNTCTKACPQDIDVMEYIAAGKRGDLAKMADISFDCIMCGLCTSRCPAELAQYNYALLARRLYAKYIAKPARHLQASLEELRNKKFDGEIDKLMKLSQAELAKLYAARNIEP